MRGRFQILTGKPYDEWTVLDQYRRVRARNGNVYIEWRCECSCGVKSWVRADNLRSGTSKRCKACGIRTTATKRGACGVERHVKG